MKFLILILFSIQAGAQNFSAQYLESSQSFESNPLSVDSCLESFMLARPTGELCFEAVKELTSRPLNASNREILFSLLTKLEKSKDSKKNFYAQLKSGLLVSHPEIATAFHLPKAKILSVSKIQGMELRAWKKGIQKKVSLKDLHLLVNGQKVNLNGQWQPPAGIFQWALVTDTYNPMIRIGEFTQFAAETLNSLTALTKPLELEMKSPQPVTENEVATLPKLEPEKKDNKNWFWPTVGLLAVGIANGLHGKKVSVSVPSFR